MRQLPIVALVATLACLAGAGTASADDVYCDGKLYPRKVEGNVYVPYRAVCKIQGAKIYGNVMVQDGGALYVKRAKIYGNVESYGAEWINVYKAHVEGNIRIEKTKSTYDPQKPNSVCGNWVKGNLEIYSNYAPFSLNCGKKGNYVDGNVELYGNKTPFGGYEVSYNQIKGDLKCQNNDPYPIGGDNRVEGNAEDQCFGFDRPSNGYRHDPSGPSPVCKP